MVKEKLKALKEIKTCTKRFLFLLEETIISLEKGENRMGISNENDLISNLFDSFLSSFTVIYNQFDNDFQKILYPISYKKSSGENGIDETNVKEETKKVVQVIKIRNELRIHMPMLPKRVPRFTRVIGMSKQHTCVIDSSSLFCYELREALLPYREMLHSMGHVTINYVFCYPKNTQYALDSDNHDTKCTTDIIAEFLPDYDSSRYCDFNYRTIFTDNAVSGTYISICPTSISEDIFLADS